MGAFKKTVFSVEKHAPVAEMYGRECGMARKGPFAAMVGIAFLALVLMFVMLPECAYAVDYNVRIEPCTDLDSKNAMAIESYPADKDNNGRPNNATEYGKKTVLGDACVTLMSVDDYQENQDVVLPTLSEYDSKFSWRAYKVASENDNKYRIVNLKTGLVLAVKDGKVVTQRYTGAANQHFFVARMYRNTFGDIPYDNGQDLVMVMRPESDTSKSVFLDNGKMVLKPKNDASTLSQWRTKFCGYWFAYDGNGATSGSMSKTLFYMCYYGNLAENAFERAGCTFDGWSTTRNGPKVYDNKARIYNGGEINRLHTVTIYARWLAPQTVRVFLQDKYGNFPSTPSYIAINNDKRLCGSTVRWSRAADSVYQAASLQEYTVTGPATKDVKVYRKTFVVSVIPDNNINAHAGNGGRVTGCVGKVNGSATANGLNGDGTTGRWRQTVYAESAVVVSSIGVKAGYHYVNMTGNIPPAVVASASQVGVTSVTQNVTVSVNTAANTYQVRYNGNGATSGSMSNSSHTYDVAKNLNKNMFAKTSTVNYNSNGGSINPSSQKPNWGFAGWAKSDTGSVVYSDQQSVKNLTTKNNDVVDLFAKWNPGSVTLANPGTKTGYEFAGWYNGSKRVGGVGDTMVVNVDVVNLTAGWTPITYEVRYNGNGATSGSMSNSGHTYDEAKNLSKNGFAKVSTVNYDSDGGSKSPAPQKPNWSFAGWAKSDTGSVVYSDQQSVKNLTSTKGAIVDLFAKWNPGSVTLEDPGEKYGFSFDGWFNGQTRVGGVGDTMAVNVDVVNLKAKWTPLWKITYVVDGDTTMIRDADLITNPNSVSVPSARTEQARRSSCHHMNGTQGLDCWYTDSSYTKKWVDGTKATGNITLYARNWATITYAHGEASQAGVVYTERGNESNKGSIDAVSVLPSAFEQSYDKTAALSTTAPSVKIVKFDAGGEFPSTLRASDGWCAERECTSTPVDSFIVKGDAVVYKKWTASIYDGIASDK